MQAALFKDRTAIVTGGARGIGLACAAKIAGGGGRVALWDRDIDRAKQSAASYRKHDRRHLRNRSTRRWLPPRTSSARPTSWSPAPASPVPTRRS